MALKKDRFQILFENKVLKEEKERMGIWNFITRMDDGEEIADWIGAKSEEEALERYKKEFLPAYGGLDNVEGFKSNATYVDQGYDFEIEFRELDMEDPYYDTFEKMVNKDMMSEEYTQSDILDDAYSKIAKELTNKIKDALDEAGMDYDNPTYKAEMVKRLAADLQGGE